MEAKLVETAARIRGLREIMDISPKEMAVATGTTEEEYLKLESGECDFGFTFLNNCAGKLGVDIVELLTGENPHLSHYSIVRCGKGLDIKRRAGFKYQHLGYRFRNKLAEVFYVTAPYIEDEQDNPITLSVHEGQEFDYIIKGKLKVALEDHIEILSEGDSIYYDSSRGHGMIATGGEDCEFLAVTIHSQKK
ncbi:MULTISPECIES: helix-turn-helix domain-containing protein [unclassified Ruminococcus]|uniref:helix-turn-helix domain-containing protein n=1 Tax=unclassified Ruminococcus TaxID=2608920 RepID=UPI00210A9EE6|nr:MULTISPECIES: XRE family transcriptional regulator [unclassified Ruminococcus]MCQ4023109.1 cupin domain-containing protein [Ruminococcus sp. zg-924]MCQ4115546.1 cupin domain-containing protein [Ruminococcus sp. zg-921]